MSQTTLSREEIAQKAQMLYDEQLRSMLETQENIGKMVIIDVETGDYLIDETGISASRQLHKKHPNAHLFGIRIGYKVADSLGGVMEKTNL